MPLLSQIESLLFISNRPLTARRLAELVEAKEDEAVKALEELRAQTNTDGRGVQLVKVGNSYQFATRGEHAKLVASFVKEELVGEMTKPQLETLTIVAYRGPVSKTELEQIRGVNCSLILRNLMIRGLVEEVESNVPTGRDLSVQNGLGALVRRYQVTHEFVRHLGLSGVEALPDYAPLSKHELLEEVAKIASANASAMHAAAQDEGGELSAGQTEGKAV
ncbi:SMC-Scp complex subunit ScpB [Candidatus Uhrbacteria bacterium RIFCSPHIGHO2_12_FULL_54_23]|uniref:SMC-Scp complex subunit ScpB n=3 Tax=Candidatus Uhriibacteriota TaxID=1752732 RepID=A0A1F7UM56_9BACT|nr:MAG: SMC-Scp complex subunit ScpB [Candidatus Uhrbacteria bacterium RIFCSPHIGHO2_12_FULL_54_23]OGL84571.1 MAG: SMC-Scp complex subunit ScpB [Candidatus Uhrbacteria bacterium RIFCSPLOWO2_01_FULL_55_36]OGL90989.1 MAG: SMC-Scp complex subunit ScpB [Candidatus Uhrbacteria bacterium RIFCSPLOWO2_02_FULL_54_37]